MSVKEREIYKERVRKTWIKSVCQRLTIIASECKQEEVKEREREREREEVKR